MFENLTTCSDPVKLEKTTVVSYRSVDTALTEIVVKTEGNFERKTINSVDLPGMLEYGVIIYRFKKDGGIIFEVTVKNRDFVGEIS